MIIIYKLEDDEKNYSKRLFSMNIKDLKAYLRALSNA
jgi:hypothetical protein